MKTSNRNLWKPMLGIVLVLLTLPAGWAQTAPDKDQAVVAKMNSKQIQRLFNDEGFTEVRIDEDDDLIVKMNGFNVLVFVRENNYSNIRFKFSVTIPNTSLKDVNDWNVRMKFAKAYLDEDNDLNLEMDVDLEGGITIARIKDAIKTFSRLQTAFILKFSKE